MFWLVTNNQHEFIKLIDLLVETEYSIQVFNSFSDTLKKLQTEIPDALLVDADPSEISCLEFCWILKSSSELRKIKIFIFSKDQKDETEIKAFENGADEFILKPIREKVSFKRIIRLLDSNHHVSMVNFPSNGKSTLRIDKEAYTVYHNNIVVSLSRKEFELLSLIASQPGKVFTREEILNKVWKRGPEKNDRTIDVHILRLRKKLGQDFISTQKGIGYRFFAS